MSRIKITVVESKCRSGYHKKVIVLSQKIYAHLFVMNCGIVLIRRSMLYRTGNFNYGNGKASAFDVKCPDGGRVTIHGILIDD